MATATLSLTGTELGEWFSEPVTAEADHYTLMDEAYPPGDTTDYTYVNGYVAEKTMRIILSHGPDDIALVRELRLDPLLVYGATITSVPALRIRVLVGGVVKGERYVGMETDSEWLPSVISIPFYAPVPGPEWYSNTVVLEFFPINGDAGYGPLPEEG